MKRYWILGGITALTVIGLVLCSLKPSLPVVDVIPIAPQNAVRTELCPGVVTDNTHLQLFVREGLAPIVKAGQSVTVTGAGFVKETYTGTVTAIAKEATVKNGKTGLVATVTLNETDDSIKKGLSAAAHLTVATYENVLVINEAWLRPDGDTWTVFVAEQGKAVRRTVTLSDTVDGGILATGIAGGERIILDPRAVHNHQAIKEQVAL